MIERDVAGERQLLTRATGYLNGRGDPDGYVVEVLERLDRVERMCGNTGWLTNSLAALAREMGEEAADIGGWGIGLNYRLDAADLDPSRREQLRLRLVGAIARAADAWSEISELEAQLKDLP